VRLVRNEENPARHAFQAECTSGGSGCGIVVPAGQMLVIENASLFLAVDPGAKLRLLNLDTYVNGGRVHHYLNPPTFTEQVVSVPSTFDAYVSGQAVRLYADPNSTVSLVLVLDGGGAVDVHFSISGYTVPVP
jgi:hypothetical protein